ncbi:MAG: acyltransferase [Clostridia bacterium]|nr:acyltransferase [Clostridia bacterium]
MSDKLASAATAGERKFYLDIMRAFAIISISMNHAVNRTYQNFSYSFFEFRSIPLWSSWIKVCAIVFGHIGVPLFLMISGALLLNKKMDGETDVKKFYKHNLLPLLITAELWYVIMYFFILAFHTDWAGVTPWSVVSGLISTVFFINQTTMDSMWYMPMILCLYMLIPYVVMIVKKVPFRMFLLPCSILYLDEMVFPIINTVMKLNFVDMSLTFVPKASNLFSIYFLYLLPGYWLSRGGLKRLRGRYIAAGAVLSFLCCCVFQFYAYSRPVQATIDYDFVLLPVLAVCIFELIRRGGHLLEKFQRPITYMAKISFAVYFVHILIMSLLEWYFPYGNWCKPLAMLFLEAVSIGGSVVIIRIFSRIPFCKKYLFMVKG